MVWDAVKHCKQEPLRHKNLGTWFLVDCFCVNLRHTPKSLNHQIMEKWNSASCIVCKNEKVMTY